MHLTVTAPDSQARHLDYGKLPLLHWLQATFAIIGYTVWLDSFQGVRSR